MAAHRYWRLFITRSGGGNSVTVGELVLATVAGGAQAATGGTASASTANGADTAALAFDGTTSSTNYWRSLTLSGSVAGTGQEYLQYDMGAGNDIDVVEMRLYFNGSVIGGTTYPSTFVLLYSDDGVHWTLQRGWAELAFTNGETKTLDATPLPSGQIFNRVVVTRDVRRNVAANSGAPTLFQVLTHRLLGVGVRHASMPSAMTPYSGNGYIAGSTTVLGDPFPRRVDLIDQRSGLLVRTIHTGPDGQFLFEWVGPGPWTIIGVDQAAEQNSVIYAHVSPAPMT